jgi:hypothetical protein
LQRCYDENVVKTLGKRLLIVSILGGAMAIGSDLWLAAAPRVNLPLIAAEWKLSAPADCGRPAKAEVQSWPGTSSTRRVCRAQYVGEADVRLTLFDMPADAAAFDAFQSWLPSRPGRVGFFKGHFFGVVESTQADRGALERFTAAIEKALPGESEGHWYRW